MADQTVDQMAAPAAPGKGKVLITGASLFIGFRTVVSTLEAGYPVLAAVPQKEDIDRVLAAPSIKRLNPGAALSFIIVPDIAADGALKEAIKKTFTSIIHCDSPQSVPAKMPSKDWDAKIMQPLLRGTNNVLSAALSLIFKTSPTTNDKPMRVVITSSMTAYVPYWEYVEHGGWGYGNYTDREPHDRRNVGDAQSASEFLAHARVNEMQAEQDFMGLSFATPGNLLIVNMMPSLILGHDELAKTTKQFLDGSAQSSNLQFLRHIRGENVPSKLPSQTVHIDDVAKAHTVALERNFDKIMSRSRMLMGADLFLSSGGISGTPWNKAQEIVEKDYWVAVEKGWLTLSKQPTAKVVQVETFPKETFGFEFATFDKQIRSMLDQWVALSAKEEKK
ncbi:MAG: hypothetical protein Q9226_008156 [Calogaya cf. arnoldii]